jgi:penicillin-binding protein 1A
MIEPRLVSKIVSKEGAVLFETKPKEIANFTRPQQAYLMTDILKDVIRRGTGRNAAVKGIELAGKTGTTNNGVDAWFCGYSPTVTTIVWYGRDNNRPIGSHATGGSVSAPAFADFYKKLIERYPNIPKHFEKPDGVFAAEINGHTELYTKISPLPDYLKPYLQKSISKIFDKTGPETDSNTTHTQTPVPPGDSSEDMEVIRIDEDPIVSEHNLSRPATEAIDPLHLKPVKPRPVGDGDSGDAMF